MISEAANTTILALFGVLLGVCLKVYAVLAEAGVRQRARSLKTGLLHMPRSYWVSLTVNYAFIGLFILTIHLTPVRMRWIPFLVSFFATFTVMAFVFNATKTGRYKRGHDDRESGASS